MTQNERPTSEVLNLAADLIEARGWVAGVSGWPTRGEPNSSLCLEGSIMAAIGYWWGEETSGVRGENAVENCPSYIAVQDYLDNDSSLFFWNDADNRTATEVIEVLRATALIEAARERETAEVSA